MRFLSYLIRIRRHHIKSPKPSLAYTREKVLYNILLIALVVGIVAYIPGVVGALRIGYYDTAIVDTLFYGWVCFLFLYPRFDYRQRAVGFTASIWLLALYLIVRFGVHGAGFVWLLVVPVMAGILLGLRAGLWALGITVATLFGLWVWLPYLGGSFGERPGLLLGIMAGNVTVVAVLLMVSASVMIGALSGLIYELEKQYSELDATKDATIETVAKLAECKDTETGKHIERTKTYVKLIAEALSKNPKYRSILTPEYIELLYKSAPLHDIGKVGIPDRILLKKGKLTEEEMEVMKRHTVIGRNALLASERKLGSNHFLRVAAEIAYSHQERWDGSGYPLGLKGDKIPLSGRIMAVADVYDALRSRRPYKEPMSHEESIAYLVQNGGVLFDPDIIALLPRIADEMEEIHRRLNDGKREIFESPSCGDR